ncbi:MAG: hypothetical protein M3033_13520 [Acidobacteriota bacterium]|nr:hypothetical protein [Acidobacteriota bacterium]
MNNWIADRENKLREFFNLDSETELIAAEIADAFEVSAPVAAHLQRFNIEWHIIPSAQSLPIDTEQYRSKLYPSIKIDASNRDYKKTSSYQAIMNGHERHQGRIIGVETTVKPKYLPGNRQFYGTAYGFETKADPFAVYLGRANFTSGTRFSHNYTSLRDFVNIVTADWKARGLMPEGYRLTICPPVVFNLVGSVFHREWSQTESLELGFYRDEHGNAKCYAVGSNAPDDFSYIHEIETDSDWALLGFRTALVPE